MSKIVARPQFTISEALKEAKGKLLDIRTRSRRSEFWWCSLVAAIASWILNLIPLLGGIASIVISLLMIPVAVRRLHDTGRSGWWLVATYALTTAYVVSIMGAVAAAMGGNPDKMMEKMVSAFANPVTLILWLLSMVLGIAMLVFCCQDSKVEPNKWGASPKYVADDDEFGGQAYEKSDFDKGLDSVGNKIDEMADKAQDLAGDTVDKVKDAAEDAGDKVKDAAGDAFDKARDMLKKD